MTEREFIKILTKLANKLDENGEVKEAARVDGMIKQAFRNTQFDSYGYGQQMDPQMQQYIQYIQYMQYMEQMRQIQMMQMMQQYPEYFQQMGYAPQQGGGQQQMAPRQSSLSPQYIRQKDSKKAQASQRLRELEPELANATAEFRAGAGNTPEQNEWYEKAKALRIEKAKLKKILGAK